MVIPNFKNNAQYCPSIIYICNYVGNVLQGLQFGTILDFFISNVKVSNIELFSCLRQSNEFVTDFHVCNNFLI